MRDNREKKRKRKKDRFILPSINLHTNNTDKKITDEFIEETLESKTTQRFLPALPLTKGISWARSTDRNQFHNVIQKVSKRFSTKPRHRRKLITRKVKQVIDTLGLSDRHISRLERRFDSIDLDQTGTIDRDEFFSLLEEKESLLTEKLFELIDVDNSGNIDFEEFVLVCATYCIYSRWEILKFCFDCFDQDKSGYLDEDEYRALCITINSDAPTYPGNFSNALQMFDINDDGVLDFKEFLTLDKRYPLLLFPAFRLQSKMQQVTLGENSWIKINERIERSRKEKDGMHPNRSRKSLLNLRHTVLPSINTKEPNMLCLERVHALKQGRRQY